VTGIFVFHQIKVYKIITEKPVGRRDGRIEATRKPNAEEIVEINIEILAKVAVEGLPCRLFSKQADATLVRKCQVGADIDSGASCL
jgi:hypothetical protein